MPKKVTPKKSTSTPKIASRTASKTAAAPGRPAMHCPFCEAEIIELKLPFCQACHVELIRCTDCLTVIPKGRKTCPSCGKKVVSAKAPATRAKSAKAA